MSEAPTHPDRKVLSEAFQQAMAGGRLQSAVFLTFNFEPGFFEQEILPVFFDLPLGHAPAVRVLHLADALRRTGPIAVYYDRQHLVPAAGPSKTDFQKIGVRARTGYFHPKNVLLLVDRQDAEGRTQRCLIVASLSANLTRGGWWENVEAAHIETAIEDEDCSFRGDILNMIAMLRRISPSGADHSAIDTIHEFARRLPQHSQRLAAGLLLPRLFSGDRSLPEFLEEVAGHRLQNRCLEILSPYFDHTQSLQPLQELIKKFRPRETRVFLPKGKEGEAQCSADYWELVRKAGASWGTLPQDLLRLSHDQNRTMHAKIYRFFDTKDRRETIFIGSINLTNAGFSQGGNVESGFLVEAETKRRGQWWLAADEKRPFKFKEQAKADEVPVSPGVNLVMRYDWSTEVGLAVWDRKEPSPPLTLRGSGVWIGDVGPLESRAQAQLDEAASDRLKQHLTSSNFVTVSVEGYADAVILVDEFSALDKPSLLSTISPEDILRYWSLLSEAQKQEFIEEHAAELAQGDAAGEELAVWQAREALAPHEASVFSTFAHVYLSFGNLERAVRMAILEGRPKEAVDRLFGQKFDSLRRLVNRLMEKQQPNPVQDYVALLCALQLLETLGKDEPAFYDANRKRFILIDIIRQGLASLKGQFTFGTPEEKDSFLDWMERWFLKRAAPPEEPAA